jgi:hypothetical protein
MALQPELVTIPMTGDDIHAVVRIRAGDRERMEKHLYQRYPHREWGSFFRFGWRRTPWGVAIFYVDGLWPEAGDLDRQTGMTTFRDQYSSRAFQAARTAQGLGIGVIHSHPEGYGTWPSPLDDDMDGYFSREFGSFTGGSPYCSLIFQRSEEKGFTFSGRLYDRGQWLPVTELITVGPTQIDREQSEIVNAAPAFHAVTNTAERLASLMGANSLQRLQSAVVGVIGCSGTGSPAIEVLARARVGEFVLVDPERLSPSNLERVHGSRSSHVQGPDYPFKVDLMREMILEINPAARVTTFAGNILHENVIDELVRCDLLLGCVDTQHARVAESDLAQHFLLPSIDMGVRMAGGEGKVTEQVVDFTVFAPDYPCAYCGGRVNSAEMAVELMTEPERALRQRDAEQAAARGGDPDQYWRQQTRQLHTVGFLTTAAGAMGAGYAEGWLTGTFTIPHSTFQFDPSKTRLACVAPPRDRIEACSCNRLLGWGEPARSYRNVCLPSHWSKKAMLRAKR